MNDKVIKKIEQLVPSLMTYDHALDSASNGLSHIESSYVKCCVHYNFEKYQTCLEEIEKVHSDSGLLDINLLIDTMHNCIVVDRLNIDYSKYCLILGRYKQNIDKDHTVRLKELINEYITFSDGNIKSFSENLPEYVTKNSKDVDEQLDTEKLIGKNIINCYYNKSSSGIGDFMRGCCYLYTILSEFNINFEMSFKYHDLSKYISSKTDRDYKESEIFDTEKHNKEMCSKYDYFENMKQNLVDCLNDSEEKDIYLFSNYAKQLINHNEFLLSDDCKTFVKDNLIFSKQINDEYNKIAPKDNYNVMHFRLGDKECLQSMSSKKLDGDNINTKKFDIDYDILMHTAILTYLHERKPTIIMSDSNNFKQHCIENMPKEYKDKIVVLHCASQHCSDNPGFIDKLNIERQEKVDNMLYVALDMKIISKSSKIISYSVYPWGSGFCLWISKLFDIPLTQKGV